MAKSAEFPGDYDPLTDIVPPATLEELPESAHPWYSYNADRHRREARQDVGREMVSVLAWIMASRLSRRQQDILQLYYIYDLSEAQVAKVLHISQPTVSQHLTGKRRAGKKVGGALAKLRKGIRRLILEKQAQARFQQILTVLRRFLDGPPTRRHGAALFKSLRTPARVPAEK